jgi:hypothetical protein
MRPLDLNRSSGLLEAAGASGSAFRRIQRHGGANDRLQRLLIDLVTFKENRWRASLCLRGWISNTPVFTPLPLVIERFAAGTDRRDISWMYRHPTRDPEMPPDSDRTQESGRAETSSQGARPSGPE